MALPLQSEWCLGSASIYSYLDDGPLQLFCVLRINDVVAYPETLHRYVCLLH